MGIGHKFVKLHYSERKILFLYRKFVCLEISGTRGVQLDYFSNTKRSSVLFSGFAGESFELQLALSIFSNLQ